MIDHQEIRFRILHTLYQKYYGEHIEHYHETEDVITESDLEGIDYDVTCADIVYLKKGRLIEGLYGMNMAYPVQIKIENPGIDAVERIVEQGLGKLAASDNNEFQNEARAISAEKNPPTKAQKFLGYIKQHPDSVVLIGNIIRPILEKIQL